MVTSSLRTRAVVPKARNFAAKKAEPSSDVDIRAQIREAARDLFIRHGLAKMTLAMVANELGISRPAVHYYYRTKGSLAEAVLEEYARVSVEQSQENWLDPETTLAAKYQKSLELARERYRRYNPAGKGDRPWSLFARFYQELDLMSPTMIARMKSVAREQQSYYTAGVNIAKARGELASDAPSTDLALQIVALQHQAGWLTWASGSFAAVESTYSTSLTSIARSWGKAVDTSRASAAVRKQA